MNRKRWILLCNFTHFAGASTGKELENFATEVAERVKKLTGK
jgi:hypothetical protein